MCNIQYAIFDFESFGDLLTAKGVQTAHRWHPKFLLRKFNLKKGAKETKG
jgi:hypothetical protein